MGAGVACRGEGKEMPVRLIFSRKLVASWSKDVTPSSCGGGGWVSVHLAVDMNLNPRPASGGSDSAGMWTV